MKTLLFMLGVASLASGCGSSGDGGSSSGADLVQGTIQGLPMQAVSSIANFSDDSLATDRGYVSVSISDWKQTCALEPGNGAQVNFTLYVMGGRRADVQPGVYSVAGEHRNGFSYEVVGGAGRYAPDGSTGAGFGSFSAGSVTIEAIAPRVKGSFALTGQSGEAISGHFSAISCN